MSERGIQVDIALEQRKKICPFKLENYLEGKFEVKRNDITTNKRGYLIKVTSQTVYAAILQEKKMMGVLCTCKPHRSFNASRGLVYITEYDIQNEESFKQGMMDK